MGDHALTITAWALAKAGACDAATAAALLAACQQRAPSMQGRDLVSAAQAVAQLPAGGVAAEQAEALLSALACRAVGATDETSTGSSSSSSGGGSGGGSGSGGDGGDGGGGCEGDASVTAALPQLAAALSRAALRHALGPQLEPQLAAVRGAARRLRLESRDGSSGGGGNRGSGGYRTASVSAAGPFLHDLPEPVPAEARPTRVALAAADN
jgi:uncharacterized membrane protein YgcG